MRGWLLTIAGAVCVLLGAIWSLQGVGVIGGSFMTNSPTWLVIGLVVAIAGVVMAVAGLRGLRKRA
jgi:hypothetical protein